MCTWERARARSDGAFEAGAEPRGAGAAPRTSPGSPCPPGSGSSPAATPPPTGTGTRPGGPRPARGARARRGAVRARARRGTPRARLLRLRLEPRLDLPLRQVAHLLRAHGPVVRVLLLLRRLVALAGALGDLLLLDVLRVHAEITHGRARSRGEAPPDCTTRAAVYAGTRGRRPRPPLALAQIHSIDGRFWVVQRRLMSHGMFPGLPTSALSQAMAALKDSSSF